MESNPQEYDEEEEGGDSKHVEEIVMAAAAEEEEDEDEEMPQVIVPCEGRTHVDGKYPSRPQAKAEFDVLTRTIHIRVDDPKNPSFWLQVTVPLASFGIP
jgi:hypothetical protein